jgi:tripartite-type tricarboxylate transporter receptor subunit TctC
MSRQIHRPDRRRPALRVVCMVAFVFVLSAAGAAVSAQGYPNRPIRMIVPFPPGGPNDIFARLVGQMLFEALGQPAVVDNRGGAGGAIGGEAAAKAVPDGYALFLGGAATLAINPGMNPRLPYDPVKDFTPISLLATAPSVLISHPSLPVKTVRDLIDLAKARPGQINYASAGIGTNPHLAGELFKFMSGANLVHVPYKGGGPATADLLAGHVQLYFSGISTAVPLINERRIRAIAVTGAARSAQLPDTPTFAEAALPGYEVNNWYALLGPRALDGEIVNTLNAAVSRGLATADVRRRIADLAAQPAGGTPKQLAAYIAAELEKWTRVIKAANIRPE